MSSKHQVRASRPSSYSRDRKTRSHDDSLQASKPIPNRMISIKSNALSNASAVGRKRQRCGQEPSSNSPSSKRIVKLVSARPSAFKRLGKPVKDPAKNKTLRNTSSPSAPPDSSEERRDKSCSTKRKGTPEHCTVPTKRMKISLRRATGSRWLRGTICPSNLNCPEWFCFVRPALPLPADYSQNRDVRMKKTSISSYLLPLNSKDQVEFILGERDKTKPFAKKVRVLEYSNRSVEEMKKFMDELLKILKSPEGNQALVETLPCSALWKRLGSTVCRDPGQCMNYADTLLHVFNKILEFGKLNKALVQDACNTILQQDLFKKGSGFCLPGFITSLDVETEERCKTFLKSVALFCENATVLVPNCLKALLPTISALCESRVLENTSFLFSLLKATTSNNVLYANMEDWRDMPLIPTTNELVGPLVEEEKHLSPVKINQPYQGTEYYMDTYFRLLRAETFASIQRGIKQLKASQLDPRDMKVYFDVTLAGYEVHQNFGLSLALQFKPARVVTNWEASSQLMPGNLLCISPNRRFDNVIWATVSKKDPKLLTSKQIIGVKLEDVTLLKLSEILRLLQESNGQTVMAESPTYFKSLKPILDSLRKFDMDSFPLRDEIVDVRPSERLPEYLALVSGTVYEKKKGHSRSQIDLKRKSLNSLDYEASVAGSTGLDTSAVTEDISTGMDSELESGQLRNVSVKELKLDTCNVIPEIVIPGVSEMQPSSPQGLVISEIGGRNRDFDCESDLESGEVRSACEMDCISLISQSSDISDSKDVEKLIRSSHADLSPQTSGDNNTPLPSTSRSIASNPPDDAAEETEEGSRQTLNKPVMDSTAKREQIESIIQDFKNSTDTNVDESQDVALHHAMTNRLAIVQGPPGCGKTFLGVKIAQVLLSLVPKLSKPILLLTYKNHALDEFIKGMLGFCKKKHVVRIGGRSKEQALDECNLRNLYRNCRVSDPHFLEIQNTKAKINDLISEVTNKELSNALGCSSYLTQESLLGELSDEQVNSFVFGNEHLSTYRIDWWHVADKNWIDKAVSSINSEYGSVKQLLFECIKSKVPDNDNYAHPCYRLCLLAFKKWLPDKNKLADLKSLQALFMQDVYVVSESELAQSTSPDENNNEPVKLDDQEDEEEVKALLDSRLLPMDGDTGHTTGDLVLFETTKKSADVLISLSDFPSNIEPDPNILSVQNLWSLSEIERIKFLYTLIRTRQSSLADQFDRSAENLLKLKKQKGALEAQHERKILMSKKIIGATITGASIHHDLLHLVGPSIVIVEEAAEILEPSLLAALTPNIEHLILIGDHQQLKPQVDTYKLTREYHFNVSLMERLIRSGFPYKTLRKQNRMRPEFAALLHDIYPALENNERRLSENTALTCIAESMFFWSHNDPEKEDRTFSNEKEADRVVALVQFLLKSGCSPSDITVLSAYLGQRKLLRQKLKAGLDSRIYIQTQTIDMFQGDENKYVIVSLVRSNEEGRIGFLKEINRRCVAQSRAKCGMYFVGNVETLTKKSSCWSKLIAEMDKKGCVGRAIPLQCKRHRQPPSKPVNDAQDIKDIMEGRQKLCNQPCGQQLLCYTPGHVCVKPCASADSHDHYACSYPVQDTFPDCGHKFKRKCIDIAPILRCEEKEVVLLTCGHATEKKCYERKDKLCCEAMVDFTFPLCGHPSPKQKMCSKPINSVCNFVVYFQAKCGHEVQKRCHEREEDTKCHVTPCPRQRDCGHMCTNICGEDCNKGDCRTCKEIYKEKMNQFRKKAREEVNELEARIRTGDTKSAREEISKSEATAAEYQKVEDQVMKYIQPMHNWYPTITKIERVSNLKLQKRFNEAKTRAFGDHIDTKFHGTSDRNLNEIIVNGFKMPRQDPPRTMKKRGMFGQGIYFATSSSKSAQDIYTKDSCKLLLCQVLLGKSKVVKTSDYTLNKKTLRREMYDSVFAPSGTEVTDDEFVIFDPDQALPQYIIHFSTYLGCIPPSQILQAAQVTSPSGQPFFKKNISASRTVDLNDPFKNYYHLAVCHFLSHRKSPSHEVESVDIIINQKLERKFEEKKAEFKRTNIPCGEILAYHGTKKSSIDSILTSNLDWTRFAQGQAYGRGNYFSEFPDVSIGYGDGLLLCRVLPGKEFVDNNHGVNIPPGFNSKKVLPSSIGGRGSSHSKSSVSSNTYGEMIIIEDPDQILPYFVIHRK